MIKVRAHTCYLGKTGYASHSRSFFRELSKYVNLKVRNFTWDNNPNYLNEVDFGIIDTITLSDGNGNFSDYPISRSFPELPWKGEEDFYPDVEIVLMDNNHHYFYENYDSPVKIAYTVWESTELEERFFNQLLKFDYLWVVSDWHKKVIVNQGYPEYRVFVVNEGVDLEFYPSENPVQEKFNFMFFGRWDYRKSVPEILETFIKNFPEEDVEFIVSADNPFSVDGLNTTEERLEKYGIKDDRIKIKHFPEREEYIDYIRNGNVLVTCARSEGWNIPLIEAMASGTPSIYSNWGAQLEFCEGIGNPVSIKEELPASIGANLGFAGNTPGLYCEPDLEDLGRVMRDCYENWEEKKKKSILESEYIRDKFSWEKIGIQGFECIKKIIPSDENLKSDECVVIMSHADTEDKIRILRRSLIALKNQGFRTIVSSHIEIPKDLQGICDFIVVDKENPIVYPEEYSKYSSTVPVHYIKYPDFDLSYSFDYNHGYAALRLIKNGLGISEINGFKITHFVNYDYIIDNPETLKSHSKSLNQGNDLVSYIWDGSNSINSGFFSGKNDSLKSPLLQINSKEDYFKFEGRVILEDVLFSIFSEFGLNMDLKEIKIAHDGNSLNNVILPTYPQIKNSKGDNSYIYLGEEENEFYICAIGSKDDPLDFEIQGNKFSASEYPMIFIKIPFEMLKSGFEVSIPKYSLVKKYDLQTRRALCRISNKNLILNLESKYDNSGVIYKSNFLNGPFLEILGNSEEEFLVDFIDQKTGDVRYRSLLKSNHWARSSIKYFVDWKIRVTRTNGETYEEIFNPRGKKVLISIDSKSLGDTIAWFPYVDEFRKKWECEIYVSTFKNDLYRNEYPDLTFVNPGSVINNLYASYTIGWFYNSEENPNPEMNPRDFRKIPMQCTASDILGIDYFPIRPKIKIEDFPRPIEEEYICIGIHSTAQSKYWNNPNGWQELTDYFKEREIKVVCVSLEENGYMQNFHPSGLTKREGDLSLETTINYIRHSKMFIGVGSGLSWLSWAIGTPTTIISGFSLPYTEPLDKNVIRIFKGGVCNGCFNRKKLDPSDWNWCPDQKGSHRQFECTGVISSFDVIKEIESYFERAESQKSLEIVVQESYDLGMVQNHKEIIKASEFFKSLEVKNFMEIGTDQGGTFAIWSKLSQDGIRISLDLPHGQFGRSDYNVDRRDLYLKSLGNNVTLIHGDSHDESIPEKIKYILSGELLDFLFIDGDHTYEGVKKDYDMYSRFVKSGGWIGFHDIKNTEFHRNANCRVDILWNELEGEKIEFIDSNSDYGGIGFIKKG